MPAVRDPPEAGETARALTILFVKPVLTAVQLVPLSVERKMPPPLVPAKRYLPDPPEAGEMARALTSMFVKPALISVQLVPLLVERKTPPPLVPAKRFVPVPP